ncbi:hypothetical protein FQA39_LY00951 [Lamprigera yunnana]|nr:hypothetical protein FQA39_LY00951 [Lamprigera yunnana]
MIRRSFFMVIELETLGSKKKCACKEKRLDRKHLVIFGVVMYCQFKCTIITIVINSSESEIGPQFYFVGQLGSRISNAATVSATKSLGSSNLDCWE